MAVSVATRGRYHNAVWRWFAWIERLGGDLPATTWELDESLCEFLDELWSAGDGLTQGEMTIAGLQHLAPQLVGKLPGPWRRLKTWGRNELPRRAPPLVPKIVRGMAGLARAQGRMDMCLALLVGFHCMLRGAKSGA